MPSYPKLHITTGPSNLSIIASFNENSDYIVDFGAFLGCRLKLTMALKELIYITITLFLYTVT